MQPNFKDFKDKSALIESICKNTPQSEKAKFGHQCCGWCERPIADGIKEGDHYCNLCLTCYQTHKAWDEQAEKKKYKPKI